MMSKLFDILCKNPAQREKLEEEHGIQMLKLDWDYYEDMKGARKGTCTL